MKLTKRQSNALDKQIEQLYYRHASGRQIDIMKIGALFKMARESHLNLGIDLEQAVKLAIETYCNPTGDLK